MVRTVHQAGGALVGVDAVIFKHLQLVDDVPPPFYL